MQERPGRIFASSQSIPGSVRTRHSGSLEPACSPGLGLDWWLGPPVLGEGSRVGRCCGAPQARSLGGGYGHDCLGPGWGMRLGYHPSSLQFSGAPGDPKSLLTPHEQRKAPAERAVPRLTAPEPQLAWGRGAPTLSRGPILSGNSWAQVLRGESHLGL